MEIYLNNSLTTKKEVFAPIKKDSVGMYNCGPTVYGKVHIGNLRSYVFADLLRRMFEYNGYSVDQVINITDVGHLTSDADTGEDKLEKAAKERGEKASEMAQKYTDYFLRTIEKLNIDTQKIKFVKATDHIKEQIELIKKLEEKGFTYKTSDGIYYDTSKFPEYGRLGNIGKAAKNNSTDGARIEQNTEKKNQSDFALWKFSPKESVREQEWDSPWGVGFPGWHLECSAMSTKYLGQPFDVHTGGIDHLQIHHNNEIAQSQAAEEKPQANYWLHHGHILINDEKISKSLKNDIYLEDLMEKKINPLSYRYWLLTSHYSTLTNYTDEAITAADTAYTKLLERFAMTKETKGKVSEKYLNEIHGFVNDDLNTPQALATIWKLIKNDTLSEEDKLATILEADQMLGLNIDENRKNIANDAEEVPAEILGMVHQRNSARENGDFATADGIRDKITALGYEIIDSDEGTTVRKS